jgi:hypothetical protein
MPKVGDIVDLKQGAFIGMMRPVAFNSNDLWTIIDIDVYNRSCLVKSGAAVGWVHSDMVVERPKHTPQASDMPLHLIVPTKVVNISLEVGLSAPKVILSSENGHIETYFYALQDEANHIHIGDEFTVTIAKK